MKKIISFLAFAFVLFTFVYIRIPSLLSHSVAYTYDQGRDFIAGANIILTHHIPFIGPTTGINGLFHGSWWYYLLAIPFVLFKGSPIGYYWFNLGIQFLSLCAFMVFSYIEFGALLSLLFSAIIAVAPYFIFTSLFVGNNIMVLPALLAFLICNYYVFTKKNSTPILLMAVGLSLGFVAEFELSFGIFVVPLYLFSLFLFSPLRKKIVQKRGVFFLTGLAIPFIPRMLFELKNSFSQTKILLSFLLHPTAHTQMTYQSIFSERMLLFRGYYTDLFTANNIALLFLTVAILFGVIFWVLKKRGASVIFFYLFLIVGLFFLSTGYHDFFWKNYYEGIQYIFLFALITIFGAQIRSGFSRLKTMVICGCLLIVSFVLVQQLVVSSKNKPPFDGLAVQEKAVDFILKNQDTAKNYCVRIYTPPVIPHTYNYLFLYKKTAPSKEWVNETCWFIVEADSNKERRQDWLQTNEPKDEHTVVVQKIKDIEVRKYSVLPKK